MLLIKESSLIRLIRKPGRYYIGGGEGINISLLISTGEVATFIGNQGALESLLYARIILIKVNNWVGSCQLGYIKGL